ncbi:retrovirus-related pol polyprotein from transposon TNT 1-94 [Tanacetum coccineum]
MRHGDYQIGNITILRVYYVEGLRHNLFSVGQFRDSDLEVAFTKHTCFVRNLEGVDLLLGSRETNLYTLLTGDMIASSLICLLSKASKTKSWLWHRRLSHLNFGAINHLAKNGLVRGLPKLKFEKDHLCSACAMGKSKKQSHKPKSEDTNQEKLYLLHMNLCGPMRVASINGKKYILVIMIQVRLNTPIRNIRTNNGTEFVNQTLRSYYESVDISPKTLVARSPQQNGVVERKNRTLVEVARTMLTAMASEQLSSGPELQSITPATSSSRLVPNTIPQQPCIPSPRDDWDHLFQPKFYEYFNPPTIAVSLVPVAVAPRTVDLAYSPVWNKDHPIANVIGDPSRSVSTRKQLQTDAMWCYFDAFLASDNPSHLYKLKKAIYGLKQAPRDWYDMLSSFLISQHFSKDAVDQTLFTWKTGNDLLLSKYASEIIKKYDLLTSDFVDTPMVEKNKLDEELQGKPVDATLYRDMIGSLMYLTSIRPDLIYVVRLCARHGLLYDHAKACDYFASQPILSILHEMKPKEPTYQVALDALAITTCYLAFLITTEVLVIYMHQFWATVDKHKASYQFKIDNKKFSVNVEVFRDILNICPMIQSQEFDEHPTKAEALSFIRELSHSGEIKYITNVSSLDKIRLSRVQILWGMYYKKNLDFVALIWEDLAYQIDNIDSKKQDKMFYHRFTKIIIHHFLTKDKSILMRNKMFMHAARDDSVLGTMRFVSRHADTQLYGAILPETMTNQAMLDSVAYKNYYVIASGAEPPKSRKSQKKSDSAISSKESPSKKKSTKAKKVASAKSKPTKKTASVKADRGKGLNVLSKVALSKAAQLKEVAKRSKKDFHISHASGLGDGTDFESGVPDEQHHKTSGTDEGTSTKSGVPNVPKYDSESDKESWGNSGEEDEDDENDSKDENGNDDNDDSDGNDDDDGNDDRIKIPVLNQTSTEYYEKEEVEKIDNEEKMDEKEDDEVTKELYDDVNVNLGNKDADMTNVDQADNEIASFMDTIVHHKEPGSQTSSLYTVPITAVPEITSVFTTTIPLPPPFFNPLPQQATPTPTPIASEATTSFPSLPDFSFVFKFNDRVTNMEKVLSEIKQVDQYAQALSFIPAKSTYEAAASLSEFKLTKILIDNMEKNKSYDKADYKMELYDALVKSYQTGKDLFDTYGEAFTLKRSRDDREKDQDPSAGSDRGTKRRKSRKEAESSRDSRSKEKKSSSTSKDASHSQHKPFGKSAHAEEPIHTVDDSRVQQNQEFDTGNNDEQPADKEVSKVDWFKKPERPQTPDPNWNKRQHIDFRPPQAWISQVARAEEPRTSFDELMDTSFDFSTFVLNKLNIKDLT